ncbi:MAG: SPOR domain-containing protein [Burkholderiales bacterium]|nr:SPOR domain-containing protein [Burkholderiales bacterium]
MPTAADRSTVAPAPEEDVTTTLYRAAIGPVGNAYYLPIFTRFEAVDHAGISWNTAAALTTVNWLVFRQLWAAALAYVGAIVAIVLLVFGIGRLVFQLSDTLTTALALGFGLAAFVLPGLFGNALLHAETRKRMATAVAAHAEIKDACNQLTRQASTRRRAIALTIANAAFWLLVLYSYLQFSALGNQVGTPQGALEAGHVAVGRTVDATAQQPVAALSPSAPVSAPASATALASASAPGVVASAPSPLASASSAMASGPVASASAAPTVSAPAAASSSPALTASAPKTSVAPTQASPTTAKDAAAAKPETRTSAPKQAEKAAKTAKTEEKPAKRAKPVSAEATAAKASAPAKTPPKAAASSSNKPYFVNVGLFAKPENAANAHAKLLEAQLPSVTKELKSAKVPSLTRVRVGPFDTQLEAQAAAARIKALQLDAIIVQP